MNKTLTLSKIMLKMYFSWSGKSSSQKASTVLIGFLMLPLVIVWFWFLDSIIGGLYQVLAPENLSAMIIALSLLFMGIVLLISSIPSVLTSFYFSDDIETYIPLPVHPFQILIGKSLGPLITVYAITLFGLGPVFLIYGMYSGASVLYYGGAMLIIFLFPLIPYVLAGLLMMTVMRYANIAKNKDRSKVIAGLFSLIFIIGINVVIRLNQDTEAISQDLGQWLASQENLLWNSTKFFPNVYLATQSLNPNGTIGLSVLSMIGCIMITGIVLAIFFFAGQKLYYAGVRGLSGGGKSKRPVELDSNGKTRSPFWSYTWKEVKTIFRTPSFFINCVIQNLFAPVFLLIMMFLDEGIADLTMMISDVNGKYMILAMFGFTLFILGSNPTATTAISREGRSWFTNLYLPVQPLTVLYSKAFSAFLIQIISLLIVMILFLSVLHIPFIYVGIWFMFALASNWFSNLFGVYLDVKQPKLDWSDEQQVFKSRFVPLQSFLIQGFSFGILILLLWNLPFGGLWGTLALLLLAIIGAVYLSDRLIRSVAKEDYYFIQ